MRKILKGKQLSCAIVMTLMATSTAMIAQAETVDAGTVTGTYNAAVAEAKLDSQQHQVITAKDIERVQAKTAEDIVFNQTGVSRTVDAMGRVGVSIRGAEPRHTLILVDGQPAIGEFAKYQGAADELSRIGTENVSRIEIIQGAASAKYGADAIGGVINVITKEPAKKAGMQLNVESLRSPGTSGILPYSNFFLRADSGEVGKAKYAIWGSKKDVIPVYAADKRIDKGILLENPEVFEKSSLRYYGQSSNIGASANFDLNDNNSVAVRMDHYTDELRRFIKRTNNIDEPAQDFRRNITRNAYNLSWKGTINDKTDLNAEINLTKVKEDDLAFLNDTGKTRYQGSNILRYIDDIDHSRADVRINGTTAVNDKHLLSYGIAYSREHGVGSRLKDAPTTWEKAINPWDYDKNLQVELIDSKPHVRTLVHDYKLTRNKDGVAVWDRNKEWYNYDASNPKSVMPKFTYEAKERSGLGYSALGFEKLTGEEKANYIAFGKQLLDANPIAKKYLEGNDEYKAGQMINLYYNRDLFRPKDHQGNPIVNPDTGKPYELQTLLNGKAFKEVYASRDNKITVGEATVTKESAYISDNWQVNDDTVVTPSLRIDHSNLFGSNPTFNIGMTHNVKGDPNTRLKANIGTGYTEPGMGELYYNWEMYSSTPVSVMPFYGGTARLGWYWEGNPNLKPEKSVNMDIGLEADRGHTTYKGTIFHNDIKNYMSIYFTGHEMDFYPQYNDTKSWIGSVRYNYAPDLIYSFKNIGRATITGFEAEATHQFSKLWSGKLGYTYLQALNKSDPTMPARLLDKPMHKIDISLNYDNAKSGWSATLYGNYYINMLDSNELTGRGNLIESHVDESAGRDGDGMPKGSVITRYYENQSYKNKSYGIWNLMVQKKFNKDNLAYIGIDNLFNHRDDARALQARVWRFGVNLKFGPDGRVHGYVKDQAGKEVDLGPVALQDFFTPGFTGTDKDSIKLVGSYTVESNTHDGSQRPQVKITDSGFIGTAEKNLVDNNLHGFKQTLNLGVDAQVAKHLAIHVLGSLSNVEGLSTASDVGNESKGLNHGTLKAANVERGDKRWTVALGKVQDKIGLTGYWFNQPFAGIKAQYTNGNTQVRFGYGDFSKSTGIADSPYTKASFHKYMRPITVAEFLGHDLGGVIDSNAPLTENTNFDKQLNDVSTRSDHPDPAKQIAIVRHMYDLVTKAYPSITKKLAKSNLRFLYPPGSINVAYDISVNGTVSPENKNINKSVFSYVSTADFSSSPSTDTPEEIKKAKEYAEASGYNIPVSDTSFLEKDPTEAMTKWYEKYKKGIEDSYLRNVSSYSLLPSSDDDDEDDDDDDDDDVVNPNAPVVENLRVVDLGKTDKEYIASLVKANYEDSASDGISMIAGVYSGALGKALEETEDRNTNPRFPLSEVTGVWIPSQGVVVDADNIPSLDRAFYVQALHKLSNRLGVSAWYMRSSGNKTEHGLRAVSATENKAFDYDQMVNVFGLGLKYQLAKNASLTAEYGRNTTGFGRYLNGETTYTYTADGSMATISGYKSGNTPSYYLFRFDMGRASYDVAGSWSAFADYKHFEHGSFFGGNGTANLPDRYLDGIASFTLGASYVPHKDFMISGTYTFGARGISQRATLFGPETFKLGNYSHVDMTYRF